MQKTTKGRIMLLSIAALLMLCGCTDVKKTPETPTTMETGPTTTQEKAQDTSVATTTSLAPLEAKAKGYTGYMEQKAGQWVEYDLQTEKGAMRQRITYLGLETIEGVQALGYEVRTDFQGATSFAQIWMDDSMRGVKYASKEQGIVICNNASGNMQGLYAMGAAGTPEEFDPAGKPSVEEYTTISGKTIEVAKYTSSDAETWVSSYVPFGLVRAVNKETGIVVLTLYDYGIIGGERTITKEDLGNCKSRDEVYKQADDLSG